MRLPVKREIAAGTVLLAMSLPLGYMSFDMEVGDPARMGPGFFPLILSILLMSIGLHQFFAGLFRGADPMVASRDELIALGAVLAALIVFALTIAPLGFIVAGFLSTIVAQVGGTDVRLAKVGVVSAAVTVLCWGVFIMGLGLRLPVLPAGF